MAKFRNVSDRTLSVDTPRGWVDTDPDAVLEVPDEFAELFEWQESLWAPVSEPRSSRRGAAAPAPVESDDTAPTD